MRTFSLSRAALFTSRTGKWHSEETSGRGEEKRKEEELQCGHCKKEWRISMASSKDRVCDNEQMVSCKGCWSLRLKQQLLIGRIYDSVNTLEVCLRLNNCGSLNTFEKCGWRCGVVSSTLRKPSLGVPGMPVYFALGVLSIGPLRQATGKE
ncbi:hypothetical protein MHYP_G00325000 [Metynnis hypsauchen]